MVVAKRLRISPNPVTAVHTADAYKTLFEALRSANLASQFRSNPSLRRQALTETQQWVVGNVTSVREAYAALQDNSEFQPWTEQQQRYAWPEHIRRFGGLFDPGLTEQLPIVTGIPPSDVKRLWSLTRDMGLVERVAAEDLSSIRQLYFYSMMLRGRFHDRLAMLSEWQVLHHQFREPFLDKSIAPTVDMRISPVLTTLAKIIVGDALSERTLSRRIVRWTELVALARDAVHSGILVLPLDVSDDEAQKGAIKAAQLLGIKKVPGVLEQSIEAIVDLGIVNLGKFLLSLWHPELSLLADNAATAAHPFAKPAKVVASRLQHWRIRKLAQDWPGRIARIWK